MNQEKPDIQEELNNLIANYYNGSFSNMVVSISMTRK